ncbi:MAG: hypothetical protein ABFE08_04070 [Armatimonadia bacterium]
MKPALRVRPYQMLCLICRQGHELAGSQGETAQTLAEIIRHEPDVPVMLVCNAHDVYAYQDPGPADDVGEDEFNRKRDLDILQALDLAPGSILPARTLLHRILKAIPTVDGLCGHGDAPAAWRGCPRADAGHYEAGAAKGIAALIQPRDPAQMTADKAASVAAMEAADELLIRPHVIMCAVCNYGNREGRYEPLAEDNIVEFIDLLRRRPDLRITMAQGADWMICAPCPQRVADLNACVNVAGSGGLSNEKRDLDLLRVLGLRYGSSLPAREMLRLIFERVPDTQGICRRDNPSLSVWWDGCGEANREAGNAGYARGREMLSRELNL